MATGAQQGHANGRSKRQLLIDEATALFGEVGYRSTSLRDIAARCGISHPGILYHFPTKDLLLRAVLEHRDELDVRRFSLTTVHGVAALERMVEVVAHNVEVPGIIELYATLAAEASTPDHPAHEYFVERYARLRDGLTQAFVEVAGEGRLKPDLHPQDLAVQTVAVLDGLQIQWLLDRTSLDMPASLRRFFAMAVTDWPAAD